MHSFDDLGTENAPEEVVAELNHSRRRVDQREEEAMEEDAAPLDKVLLEKVNEHCKGLRGSKGRGRARGAGITTES